MACQLKRSALEPCAAIFNRTAVLQPDELTRRYGGYRLADGNGIGVNHLIWSNGLLDPWHGGGFLTPGSNSSGNHWILMPHGAHHVDLRAPHPDDPEDITACRQQEERIMWGWIQEATAR